MRRAGPFCLLLVLVACAHHPAATTPRAPPGPDVPGPSYYTVPGPVPAPQRAERVWREAGCEMWEIDLPPRVAPDTAMVPRSEDPIDIRLFLPRPTNVVQRPLVVVFPILGNRMLLMRELATGFVRQGYVAAVVMRKEVDFDVDRSLQLAEQELRILMMRARQAIDWLALQPQVDPERIGACGVSAGGVMALTLMAADPRVDAAVAVFAGGPTADVLVDTSEDRFVERTELMRVERGWSKERVRSTLRSVIRTDPVLLAPRIRREDVLLFIARDDDSVPTRYQRRLWEALDRPEMIELGGGHYAGIALHLPYILQRSQAFLGKRLGRP
ncbi:MAG: prolyl oligopeptidase family serine peptidase [Planctomycetota bacterium]|nr:prolyl oligopeptidase family serine peptidase [Planctomycetota bacterium]